MLYAWAPLNAAGHTKKVTTTAIFFVAQCVGNVSYHRPALHLSLT